MILVLAALANLLHFVGLALAVGAVTLRFGLMNRSGLAQTERMPALRDAAKYGLGGAAAMLAAAPIAATAQAMGLAFPGDALWPLLRTVVGTTEAGRAIALQAVWAGALLAAFSVARLGPARGWTAAALAVMVSAIAVAMRGHAAAAEHRIAAQVAMVMHVLGGGAWIGGLFHLWRIARKASDATLTRLIAAFHAVAGGGALLMLVSGAFSTWILVDSLAQLTGFAWGRLLLAKLTALAGVAWLGYRHWRGSEAQAVADRAALRTSFKHELWLAAVVFILTAFLTSVSPEG